MSEYPHLQNAPITEALVDIQVNLPPETDITAIKKFGELVKDEYPKEYRKKQFSISIQDSETKRSTQKEIVLGFAYESLEKHRVVQSRLDGFTYSQLKKYETWDILKNEAARLWDIYLEVTKPISIKRATVRFINSLEFGLPLTKYLKIPPMLPSNLPQKITNSLSRVRVDDNTGTSIILTQVVKEPIEENTTPVILDIDVFRVGPISLEKGEVWNIIESFHTIKNKFFFETLHQKAWELYQ